jgi:DNA-binding NarL/FixJ family response regulator
MGASGHVGLVADDDAYFRIAVSAILTCQLGFSEVVEASTLDEAVDILGTTKNVCFALFDLSMPGVRSAANLRTVREAFPAVRVGIISASSARRDILLALEAGVHGYMPKHLSVAELTAALRAVFSGGIYVPSCLATIPSNVDEAVSRPLEIAIPEPTITDHVLTSRQRDVLDLLVQGKTNKEIALALDIGEGTVKIHVAAIFRYFGVNNRAAAAVAGARPNFLTNSSAAAAVTKVHPVLEQRRELSSVR